MTPIRPLFTADDSVLSLEGVGRVKRDNGRVWHRADNGKSGTVNDLANISRVWNPPISDTQKGLIFSSLQCHLKFLFTLIHFLKCRILKVCLNG